MVREESAEVKLSRKVSGYLVVEIYLGDDVFLFEGREKTSPQYLSWIFPSRARCVFSSSARC